MTTTYQYRRQRGLCYGCGRRRAQNDRARWLCAFCLAPREPPAPLTLGERVRQRREELGYTKVEFGAILGITGDHVSGLEHGTWPWKPSRPLRRRLADLLGCRLADLDVPPQPT